MVWAKRPLVKQLFTIVTIILETEMGSDYASGPQKWNKLL